MRTAIGARVRRFREDIGLSPDDAAAQAGVPANRWESIESGSLTPATGDVLRMSAVLGVPFSTLVGPPLSSHGAVVLQPADGGAVADLEDVQSILAHLNVLADASEQLCASGYRN